MASLKTYSADKVTIVFGAIVIDGYADGEFVSVEQDEDGFGLYVGSGGEATRSKTNNLSATITFTVQQSADCNDLLSAQYEIDQQTNVAIVPLLIKDNSGRALYAAAKAWIQKPPTAGYARDVQTRQWTIRTNELKANYGGN